jgi:hypothetical protein
MSHNDHSLIVKFLLHLLLLLNHHKFCETLLVQERQITRVIMVSFQQVVAMDITVVLI